MERTETLKRQLLDSPTSRELSASLWETLKRALLWALGRALDSEFDAETRAAWSQLLDAVAAAMLAPESVVR